ncbi:hypothetical protein I203_107367 [Kwoniella mangroviensis CBS 8507]|uniref:hypothetical protein n=1 Tax=Kwoniella mangroviensis CBS 8507 TaxID=1296122 RepID=UPI00080D23B1|nr:uncharacterized protein I203_02116 [Kwoniella mangroviensis CBS 8507]OCF68729.1 hypothetical protein I203_02116 [Kwoniella mangroviensis CBS 8507]
MSMFSSFSFKSLDESPKPRTIHQEDPTGPYSIEEDVFDQDHGFDSYHSLSGLGSDRQSRSSLTALAEDDEEEEVDRKDVSLGDVI